jgi:LPXTG-motif cell wall-anchored protein
MNIIVSLILTVGGILLIAYGINASESLGSDVSRLFTGSPTDETIWLLVGGIVMLAVGIGGLTFRRKSR